MIRYLSLVLMTLLGAPAVAWQGPTRTTHVLFLGNSYTYFNNLPEMFAKLAAAGGQGEVVYKMLAPGGTRLKDHWDSEAGHKALAQGAWDYVVLQDQSTLGMTYLVEGTARIAGDVLFRPFADRWVAEIKKAGAKPVFYLTWARKAAPRDQDALNYAYVSAARETHSIVAPVGFAWASVRKRYPAIELFYEDGSHPSAAGSYLAACTLYATLFRRSPVGLPSRVTGIPVNLDTEQPEPDKMAILADLKPEVAQILQATAWDAEKQFEKASGYIRVSPQKPPELPPLPEGQTLADANLEGTWRGSLLLVSPTPAEMIMRLERSGTMWKGHLDIKYHEKGRDDVSFDLPEVRIDERRLSFENPRGPAGTTLLFTGALLMSGEIVGTADASFELNGTAARILGSWKLRRR